MSPFLQRLLARTAPDTGTGLASVNPVAPLSSPLAGHDQRLGIPDFDPFVPADVGDSQIGDGEEPLKVGDRPSRDPKRVRDGQASARRPPELRIVTEIPAEPESAEPLANAPDPVTPDSVPPADVQFAPGPLDIEVDDLEPVSSAQPVAKNVAIEPEPPVTADSEVAKPAAPESQTSLLIPSEAVDALPNRRREGPVETLEPDETGDRPLPAARQIGMPEPTESVEAIQAPRDSPFDVEPLGRPDVAGAPDANSLRTQSEEPRSVPAVVIDQIIIDVREPPQAPPAQLASQSAPPSTAAAASIIGPLPVRRSTISLYGMRRR